MCAQIEMNMLRLIESLDGTASKLSRIRMVLCQAERGEVDMSRRFFRKYRQLLYKIRKTPDISSDDKTLCTRLLMRLASMDPTHKESLKKREEKMAQARSKLKLAHDESLVAPPPKTGGPDIFDNIDDFLKEVKK